MINIDLGFYQHKKNCKICQLDSTQWFCWKGNQLKTRFFRKGKIQQEKARIFGHTNIIGFIDYV